MSVATAVPTVSQTDVNGKIFRVIGAIAIGASPLTYAAGGLVMALNDPLIKAQRAPQSVIVQGQAGYIYRYVKGTDNTNGKLMIFEQSGVDDTPLDEFDDTVAIPAAISGDTINFIAEFLGQN